MAPRAGLIQAILAFTPPGRIRWRNNNTSSHNIAHKYEQYIYNESIYKKMINEKVILQEDEQMYICWYYRYGMELILEKYGFKDVTYQEEYFRDENHMIFIAE